MEQEFEYTIETRFRRNLIPDGSREYPDPPNWDEWSEWQVGKTYPTLAGAAMAKAFIRGGVSRQYYEPKRATHETESRVSYRKVPKGWTPLLPNLEGE